MAYKKPTRYARKAYRKRAPMKRAPIRRKPGTSPSMFPASRKASRPYAGAKGKRVPKVRIDPDASGVQMFIKAQTEPFGEFRMGPGIPDLISTPSQKSSYHFRGTMTTATCGGRGRGFIIVNPYLACNAKTTDAVTNQDFLAPIFYSNGTAFTIADILPGSLRDNGTAIPAGVTPEYYVDAPYAAKQAETYVNDGTWDYRVVGCGVKLHCTSQPLYRQGDIVLYEDTTNGGILDKFSGAADLFTEVKKDFNQTFGPVDDASHSVVWKIKAQDDMDTVAHWTLSNWNDAKNYDSLAIFIDNASTANPLTFEFEVTIHVEIVGTRSVGRTLVPSNIQYLSKALAALPQKPQWGTPQYTYAQTSNNFWSSLGTYF